METKQQELKIKVSEAVAEGIYANLTVIAHSSSEFVLDFIRIMPGQEQASVRSRIILNAQNAKQLLLALQNNIGKYEQQFGTIDVGGIGGAVPMSFEGGEA